MRLILTLAAFFALTLCSCKKDDSADRKKFADQCKSKIPNFLNQEEAVKYCDCNTDTLFAVYSAADLNELDSLVRVNAPQADSIAKHFQAILAPCLATFMKNAGKIDTIMPAADPNDTIAPSQKR